MVRKAETALATVVPTPLKGGKPRGYRTATPANVVRPVRRWKTPEMRAVEREQRHQEEREDDNRMWDRLTELGKSLLSSGPGVLAVAAGAVGGAAAFRPINFVYLGSAILGSHPYPDPVKGPQMWRRWRFDYEARGIMTGAIALDVKYVGHFGMPTTFSVLVDDVGAFTLTDDDRARADMKAKAILSNHLTLWGMGTGAGLAAMAGSLGTVFRK